MSSVQTIAQIEPILKVLENQFKFNVLDINILDSFEKLRILIEDLELEDSKKFGHYKYLYHKIKLNYFNLIGNSNESSKHKKFCEKYKDKYDEDIHNNNLDSDDCSEDSDHFYETNYKENELWGCDLKNYK